jgi:hypothetical protein
VDAPHEAGHDELGKRIPFSNYVMARLVRAIHVSQDRRQFDLRGPPCDIPPPLRIRSIFALELSLE